MNLYTELITSGVKRYKLPPNEPCHWTTLSVQVVMKFDNSNKTNHFCSPDSSCVATVLNSIWQAMWREGFDGNNFMFT